MLVVDDEPHILHYMHATLEAWGHVPVVAQERRARRLELADREQFDLVISDLRMPELGGREFYEELARRHPALAARLVFSTGDTVRGDTLAFLESLDRPYLHKPFSLAELRHLLASRARAARWPSPRRRDASSVPPSSTSRRDASGAAGSGRSGCSRASWRGWATSTRSWSPGRAASWRAGLARDGVPVRAVAWRAGLDPRVLPAVLAELRPAPALVHAHDAHAVTLGRPRRALDRPAARRHPPGRLPAPPPRRSGLAPPGSSPSPQAVADVLVADGIPADRDRRGPLRHRPRRGPAHRLASASAARSAFRPRPVVAANVGALVPHKDHATLLRAAARLAERLPDAPLGHRRRGSDARPRSSGSERRAGPRTTASTCWATWMTRPGLIADADCLRHELARRGAGHLGAGRHGPWHPGCVHHARAGSRRCCTTAPACWFRRAIPDALADGRRAAPERARARARASRRGPRWRSSASPRRAWQRRSDRCIVPASHSLDGS